MCHFYASTIYTDYEQIKSDLMYAKPNFCIAILIILTWHWEDHCIIFNILTFKFITLLRNSLNATDAFYSKISITFKFRPKLIVNVCCPYWLHNWMFYITVWWLGWQLKITAGVSELGSVHIRMRTKTVQTLWECTRVNISVQELRTNANDRLNFHQLHVWKYEYV